MTNQTYKKRIEGVSEFNANTGNPVPPAAAPNTPPQNTPPQAAPAGFVTQAELEQRLAKARTEEKDKLYGRIDELEKQAKEAKEARKKAEKDALKPDERLFSELEELKTQVAAKNEETQALLRHQEQERYKYTLALHRENLLRQADAYGNLLVDPAVAYLVHGNTIEELNASIAVARAEFEHLRTMFAARFGVNLNAPPPPVPPQAGYPQQGYPPQPAPTAADLATPPGGAPYVAPTVTQPGPVPGAGDYSYDQITQMTDHEAVRNGTYAKNREQILGKLKQTQMSGTVQLPMRPMPGYPVQQPAPQYVPPAQPGVPHTQMPYGMSQPQGYPTYPPNHPGVPPNAGWGMPNAGQPPPNPAQQVDAMRQAAAQSAHQALANPHQVNTSGVLAAPPTHPEYQAPQGGNHQVPSQQHLAQPGGGNPMHRN